MNERKHICVYCASSTQIDPRYFQAARELGRLMAERGITLINGAGSMGLMAESADGCLENGGEAIGIIPTFMIQEGWCHTSMTRIIETDNIHIRQEKMAEMMELITWKQLGIYLKPIILLNTLGYYNATTAMLQQAVEQRFMRLQHADIWRVASTPEEALEMALTTPEWDRNIRRFAKI